MDLKQPLKKIIHLSLVGLTLILALINIYNTNQENNRLIDTASEILGKTENINSGLEKNLELVRVSSDQISTVRDNLKVMETTMGTQSTYLERAVEEAEKLNEQTEKAFLEDRPLVATSSPDVKLAYREDSNSIFLDFPLLNSGKRIAYNLVVEDAIIIVDFDKRKYVTEFVVDEKLEINKLLSGREHLGNFGHPYTMELKPYLEKELTLFLVLKISYRDESADIDHEEYSIFISEDYPKTKSFSNALTSHHKEIMRYINENEIFKDD